ncbi:MAG TPA: NUDIX domain-containing protein [Gammaproteobacteria bacterium]|jgi:8-oxo-dGTP diphosphatase|nr:NUDIX domain-containing protein [Gammaproteobacteria bacterium]
MHSNIRVAVGILTRADTILVAQRPPNKPYSGYWEFPGGKIEAAESGETAVKRELAEELGIHVTAAALCFTHTHAYPDKTVLLEIWRITAFSGEPEGKENQAVRWVSWPEMLALRLLEGNQVIMSKIKEQAWP